MRAAHRYAPWGGPSVWPMVCGGTPRMEEVPRRSGRCEQAARWLKVVSTRRSIQQD